MADTDNTSAQTGTDAAAAQTADQKQTADAAGDGKTFSQADLDKVVSDRLARAQKKWDTDHAAAVQAAVQAELDKQKLSNEERLKLEKDEADKRAATATQTANARLLKAEAKVVALAAGVNPEFVDDVIALAKVEGDSFFTDGEPDPVKIKASVDAALVKRPFYKAGNSGQGFGSDMGGGHGGTSTVQQLEQRISEARKAGDISLSMALTDQLTEMRSKAHV